MCCPAIPTARSAASLASYARRSARRRRSPSRRDRGATTARGAPRATISTWSSASTAVSARRRARWTPSSRGRTSSSPPRHARNFTTTRSACLRTATAGSARSPRTSNSTRRIAEDVMGALFFYLFAGVAVASAFMVIAAKNPVHSVLYLILTFVNAAGLFVLVGAEFLAMILIVVYVGAVAVLFLFVVMMLDVDFAEFRQGFLNYLPVGGVVGIILLIELVFGVV